MMRTRTPLVVYYIIETPINVSIIASLFDALLPPRNTDLIVRSVTLTTLQRLVDPHTGMLPYHDPRVTALVWELKYHANKRATNLAGELLYEQLLAIAAEELGIPLLIPIPMHKNRKKRRGHNQTEILCQEALQYTGSAFEYGPYILEKIMDTRSQQGLERHKRLKNVHSSMQVTRPEQVTKRVCVVVDDVTTTGATLDEARRALLKAGAARVHLVALAHS